MQQTGRRKGLLDRASTYVPGLVLCSLLALPPLPLTYTGACLHGVAQVTHQLAALVHSKVVTAQAGEVLGIGRSGQSGSGTPLEGISTAAPLRVPSHPWVSDKPRVLSLQGGCDPQLSFIGPALAHVLGVER